MIASRSRGRQTVERFGGIDICVNNASGDRPPGRALDLSMKGFEPMNDIKVQGTFALTQDASRT